MFLFILTAYTFVILFLNLACDNFPVFRNLLILCQSYRIWVNLQRSGKILKRSEQDLKNWHSDRKFFSVVDGWVISVSDCEACDPSSSSGQLFDKELYC